MNYSSSGDKFERRRVFGLLRNCSCLSTQCNDEELGTYQQKGRVWGLQMKNTKMCTEDQADKEVGHYKFVLVFSQPCVGI